MMSAQGNEPEHWSCPKPTAVREDLVVLNPSGGTVGTSLSAGSVWEKVRQTGNLTPGNYTVRFVPFSMPRPSQVVYYTVIASYQ